MPDGDLRYFRCSARVGHLKADPQEGRVTSPQIIPRHYYLASGILFALTHSWESWMYLVVCAAQGNALSFVFSIEFSIFSLA
jgi:hypothetical protein